MIAQEDQERLEKIQVIVQEGKDITNQGAAFLLKIIEELECRLIGYKRIVEEVSDGPQKEG